MKLSIIALTLVLVFFNSITYSEEYYGKYSGPVKTEWLDDGRKMKILEYFFYEDPNGIKWEVPTNSIIDGASIPTFAWSFIGAPYSGKFRNASVVHDIACQKKERTWQLVHLQNSGDTIQNY